MAKRPRISLSDHAEVSFSVRWPNAQKLGPDALADATLGRLKIALGRDIATHFRTDRGDEGDEILVPLVNIAEWLVENWWSLLYEPKKSEEEEENDEFQSRHWLGCARHGFSLPDVWFIPTGESVEVSARETYLRHARVQFTSNAEVAVPTDEIRSVLSEFVQTVLDRIVEEYGKSIELHNEWKIISDTEPEEEEYCRLIGALGLSPYEDHKDIERKLVALSKFLSPEILRDLCQAADVNVFSNAANVTEAICKALPDTKPIDLSPLSAINFPEDRFTHAWQHGITAVQRVRRAIGINSDDVHGGDRLFEELGLDPLDSSRSDQEDESHGISGVLSRTDDIAHLAIASAREPQIRFTAARAAFLGWSYGENTTRLLTTSRTRRQQASRAFAAELLAPIAYINSRASDKIISFYRIQEIADELCVSPAVVSFQARNNHFQLV